MSCLKMTTKTVAATFCVIVTVLCSKVYADDWARLQQKADEIYGGWDITVKVKTGLQANSGLSFQDDVATSTDAGPYGRFEITAPLYSKNDRIKNKLDKTDFLKQGAELIRQINENAESVKILESKANVMKAVMKDEGVKGIEAYYDVLQEISAKEIFIKEAQMKLEAMLK